MLTLSPFYQELLAALNRGLVMSLALIVPSAVGGVVIGISAGALRVFGARWLRWLGDGYAALFRGTPLVVQLFVLYFGLPNLGLYLSPYAAAVIGFVLCSGAYQSEYVRGALLSIKRGQYLGAQALGFTGWQTVRWIIVPQAVRRAIHGCGNEIIYLIKYSSLAYIVTCMELTGEGKTVATEYFRFTEVFAIIGLYYLGLVTLAIFVLKRIEQRLFIPGFGHQ
ncbi:amino acid ABC transporter membrane protein 2, PAAT family [Desulfobulbus propionicus DSM 2032]|jgi:polar amino acid transport system permease protein|uniref:Amino acid ABC transporter membrane protein 2, PAAT family n=1 Tax=Desulfobulbus propionicus (strain ATCC 33891 / DSM 2032 / VKM B-1956 / 1pr3) TaxID=577650 RepID=A0A7U3YKP1_DESPD|nr:amino acid ABC transporter permease [Desulfobulbus propionicus]ADW17159.1 amino acid ABC transporter membrane protein 2, PAAT family [Desulfobulbus propionicus DSM 2032]